jgi:hypothetical protein
MAYQGTSTGATSTGVAALDQTVRDLQVQAHLYSPADVHAVN